MKLSVLFVVGICCSLHCIAARKSSGAVGNVEGGEDQLDHDEFDQELWAGGRDDRQRISDLSPEEAAQEIRKLVDRIDEDDDGKISKAELKAWLKKVEDHSYKAEADDLFEKEDANEDGFIKFDEFIANSGEELEEEGGDQLKSSLGRRFLDADANKDGKLDQAEFVPFIHPFRHEKMLAHLVEDQLVDYDLNQDGQISMEEYIQSFDPDDMPEEEVPDWQEQERAEFMEHLDKDHDGFLDYDEIKEWLAPNEEAFFEEEADHLLKHADKDKDGFLTVEEVEAEFDVFEDSSVTDYGHMVHEEL